MSNSLLVLVFFSFLICSCQEGKGYDFVSDEPIPSNSTQASDCEGHDLDLDNFLSRGQFLISGKIISVEPYLESPDFNCSNEDIDYDSLQISDCSSVYPSLKIDIQVRNVLMGEESRQNISVILGSLSIIDYRYPVRYDVEDDSIIWDERGGRFSENQHIGFMSIADERGMHAVVPGTVFQVRSDMSVNWQTDDSCSRRPSSIRNASDVMSLDYVIRDGYISGYSSSQLLDDWDRYTRFNCYIGASLCDQ